MRKFILFASLVLAPSVFADTHILQPGCESENVPARYWDESPVVEDHNTVPYKPCDHTNLSYLMRQAWSFIAKLPETFDPSNPYANSIIDFTPRAYVHDNLWFIRILVDVPKTCEHAGAFVSAADPKVMMVCANSKDVSTIIRAEEIVHETRHSQGFAMPDKEGFPHERCKNAPNAFDKDNASCDTSLENVGAYSAGFEFLLGVTRLKEVSDSVRAESRAEAVRTLIENFNARAEFKEGAALVRNSGDLVFFDGKSMTPIIASFPKDNFLLHEDEILRFYSPAAKTSANYAFNGQMPDFEKGTSPYPSFDRVLLNDTYVLFRADGVAIVNRDDFDLRRVTAHPHGLAPDTLMVLNDRWANPKRNSTDHIYLRYTDGSSRIVPIPFAQAIKNAILPNASPEMTLAIARYRAIALAPAPAFSDGRLMGLRADNGQLEILPPGVLVPGKRDRVTVVPGTVENPIRQMASPILWSPEIEAL